MSRVSDMRIEIQESPEYRDGFVAFGAGISVGANPWPVIDPQKRGAWALGWEDASSHYREPAQ